MRNYVGYNLRNISSPILNPYTIIDKGAMMIEIGNTAVAYATVFRSEGSNATARVA